MAIIFTVFCIDLFMYKNVFLLRLSFYQSQSVFILALSLSFFCVIQLYIFFSDICTVINNYTYFVLNKVNAREGGK